MAPAAVRKNSLAALMATAKIEAAKEASVNDLTEKRRTAILAGAGLSNVYHLDTNRNDDLKGITDYGAKILPSTTSVGAYHDIILRDTKKALGVDKNGWAALQQDVKKFMEQDGGVGKDDDEEVAKQFLESGDKVKMGNKHFGILPGAEAEGFLINEGGLCWGLDDEKLLPLIATLITAAKAVATPVASALGTTGKKRARPEEMISVTPAEQGHLPKKRRIANTTHHLIVKPTTLNTLALGAPVRKHPQALIAIAATAPVELYLDSVLFNNGTRFGPSKLLNLARSNTLHGLFVQINKTYRLFFNQLHLSTLGICFFRLRILQDSNLSEKFLEGTFRQFEREAHREWKYAVEVMNSTVERKGVKALESLLLEVHFDALLSSTMMRYINDTIIDE
ncbi:MAG: hypothetical protein M1812_007726 [Candelaria pacifica]|nr:MAG: hypothetical protein M1812_007726 [Candelaria pacifica]